MKVQLISACVSTFKIESLTNIQLKVLAGFDNIEDILLFFLDIQQFYEDVGYEVVEH